jgi:hypothetical protein
MSLNIFIEKVYTESNETSIFDFYDEKLIDCRCKVFIGQTNRDQFEYVGAILLKNRNKEFNSNITSYKQPDFKIDENEEENMMLTSPYYEDLKGIVYYFKSNSKGLKSGDRLEILFYKFRQLLSTRLKPFAKYSMLLDKLVEKQTKFDTHSKLIIDDFLTDPKTNKTIRVNKF